MMYIRYFEFMRFLIILFLFCIFQNNAFSNNIENIEVNGNKRISKETIIVIGDINIDKYFDNNEINNTVKKLYESDFFSNIEIYVSENSLIVNVDENPIINDIEFINIKNKSLVEKLEDVIILKKRNSFTESKLKKDITTIKNFLKINGYYFSKVQSSIVKNEQLNSIQLLIDVNLGEKSKIKEISFVGDKKIKDKKLLRVIASEEHKFWKFLSNKVYLNQSIVDLDVRLLQNYYKNLGYYDAKIANTIAEFDEEGFFKLIFTIDSGELYYFNNFDLLLPEDYNKKDFQQLDNLFDKLKETKYSLEKLTLILRQIEAIASERLYDFIDVDFDEKITNDNKINYVFNIKDSRKFYIEKINILGNFQTVEKVIRNRFVIDEGDPLNKLLYNKNLDNIKALRIFKDVKAEIKDGSNQNLKIIDLTVEEQPTGEIMLAAGAGTDGITIGGGIKEKNFLGQGINLNSEFEITSETLRGKVLYSQPNFAYSDNSLTTSFESSTTDRLSDYGYKVKKTSLSIGTSSEQYENFFYNPELSIIFEDLETDPTASTNYKKQAGNYKDLYFNYSLSYDKTNSRFEPSSGSKINFFQELPLISDNDEISNTFIYTKYKNLNPSINMIGKASFYLKSVNNFFNDNDVRISKRAFVPSNRLRGFERGKVGPVENSDFIGGNYVYAANLSTNLPQILTTVENLDFSYFIDIANVWGVDYDSTIDDSNKIRSSTGIAMDVLTPVGPLTLSYSFPISKNSTDKTESIRFNIGTTF